MKHRVLHLTACLYQHPHHVRTTFEMLGALYVATEIHLAIIAVGFALWALYDAVELTQVMLRDRKYHEELD